jgi:hypothetical protein
MIEVHKLLKIKAVRERYYSLSFLVLSNNLPVTFCNMPLFQIKMPAAMPMA